MKDSSAQAQAQKPTQTLQAKESNNKENACFTVAPIQLVNNADSECVTLEESKDATQPKQFGQMDGVSSSQYEDGGYNMGESTLASTTVVTASNVIEKSAILNDFNAGHPTLLMSRSDTTEVERQNINVNVEYGDSIAKYMRELEVQFLTDDCLIRHKITPALRARMIDWMIEVLTNFKCDD